MVRKNTYSKGKAGAARQDPVIPLCATVMPTSDGGPGIGVGAGGPSVGVGGTAVRAGPTVGVGVGGKAVVVAVSVGVALRLGVDVAVLVGVAVGLRGDVPVLAGDEVADGLGVVVGQYSWRVARLPSGQENAGGGRRCTT